MNLNELFETEWRKNLLAAALERVKAKVSSKQFQMFDLHALKEWPAGDAARSLGVSRANVYVTKHPIAAALEKEMGWPGPGQDRSGHPRARMVELMATKQP